MATIFPACGQRLVVVGTTGSGKTTLARQIAPLRHLPHIELDALYWEPHWTPAPPEVFRERVRQALDRDRWIVDGNYSLVRDMVWRQADTVIFLDYPFGQVFWQLLRRTVQRSLNRVELWSGNRETLRQSFFSQQSILLWMWRTYPRNRRCYPQLFQQPEYAHLQVIHLQTRQMMADWLAHLAHD